MFDSQIYSKISTMQKSKKNKALKKAFLLILLKISKEFNSFPPHLEEFTYHYNSSNSSSNLSGSMAFLFIFER